MSRVKKPGNKYVNTSRHDADVYETPKKVQIPDAADDYHKARTLTRWLYLKYNMSYKAFEAESLQQMYECFCTYMENMRRKAAESYDWRVVKLMGDGIMCGCQ